MEYVTSAILGVALAASCGFRVFVPLLVASCAAHVGWLSLAADQAWLGSTPALVVLSVAAVVEVLAMHARWPITPSLHASRNAALDGLDTGAMQ
jgi:uncharacterized membrane protein